MAVVAPSVDAISSLGAHLDDALLDSKGFRSSTDSRSSFAAAMAKSHCGGRKRTWSDSSTWTDDTMMSAQSVLDCNGDSNASTNDSMSAAESPCDSRKRAPSDFGFVCEKEMSIPLKVRRTAAPSSPQTAPVGRHLRVCGPERIQTLRGRMFGREVALILCGESHEDTIDLTRRKGVMDAVNAWITVPPSLQNYGFNPEDAYSSISDITLREAKAWGEDIIAREDDKGKCTAGAMMVFTSFGRINGHAAVFPPSARRSPDCPLARGSVLLEFADTDQQAREFNKRRMAGAAVPVAEADALIAERKAERLAEGFELFDDWLIRQAESSSAHVEFLQEAPVSADELELHVDPNVPAAPQAAESLRQIDLDSDEDNDPDDPQLGSGCFLDYLRRQTLAFLPHGRAHGIDVRVLGDAEDDNLQEHFRGSFQEPRFQNTAAEDAEASLLSRQNAQWARLDQVTEVDSKANVVPSFEAWLGGAADLLYHSPHIKADFAPFLGSCVGSAEKLWRFFDALYFETVPEALGEICVDEKTRPSTYVRSLAYRSSSSEDAPLQRRPIGNCCDGRRPIAIRRMPLDRYLKARGFDTPRTWISGLAERLRQAGAQHMVNAAKMFYHDAVDTMLADPKNGDRQGDNFVAWLRACHRDIFIDIDSSDPDKLQRKEWAASESHPRSSEHAHCLKSITIPGLEAAFKEIVEGRSDDKPSTVRQRMMSKFIVDAFALRSVDLAIILKIANIVSAAPADKPAVVVMYAGADHTDSVAKFWRSWGFSHSGLPQKGKICKKKGEESSCLSFPPYMHDFSKLFPLPAEMKDVALRMAQCEGRGARRPRSLS